MRGGTFTDQLSIQSVIQGHLGAPRAFRFYGGILVGFDERRKRVIIVWYAGVAPGRPRYQATEGEKKPL